MFYYFFQGSDGFNGAGGFGGAGSRHGNTISVLYADLYIFFVYTFGFGVIFDTANGNKIASGADGVAGKNKEGISSPDPAEFIHPSHSINSYKSFVRENLPNNFAESNLKKFMIDIDGNERIQSLYNTMGFFNELQELENQYLHLRYSTPFIPYYMSLADRIDIYSKSSNESADHTKILRFLYTTALGKISNLRNFRNHVAITDLFQYLEIVQKNIGKMRDIDKAMNIEEQKQQYQNAMMNKVDAAIEIIDNEISPALLEAFTPLSKKIIQLIELVMFNREQTRYELQELADAIRRQKILGGLQFIATTLQSLGGIFTAIGVALEAIIPTIENILKVIQALNKLLPILIKKLNELIEFIKEGVRIFLDQLHHMLNKLYGYYKDLRNYIEECIGKVKDFLDSEEIVFQDAMDKMRADILKFVHEHLGRKELYDSKSGRKKPTPLEEVGMIADLDDLTEESWKAAKEQDDVLVEMYDQQAKLKAQLNKWDDRLKDIMHNLLPMFVDVQRTIIKIANNLQSQTAIQLDISSWKVNSILAKLKLYLQQMTEDTPFEKDISRMIENMQEAFSTLIKVYDRIQSYIDQSKFAGYLADLNSENSQGIDDPQLRNAVLELRKILQSNVVMEQYEVAIHSFKQHYFPFAVINLVTFDMPSGLQASDTEILVRRASEEIDYLQEQVMYLGISIGKYDREIFGNIDFNSEHIAVPFYKFQSREYKYEIRKLLTGEEVLIKADVTRGLNQNAVKFNKIGIKLKLSDEKMQKKLDSELDKFGVRMTMVGHNYYRCGQKFYYLSVDDSIVIEQSFKKDSNGTPLKFNEVYRKLSEKQYFLSPYTTWKIQLIVIAEDFTTITDDPIENTFDNLKKFEKETINMELIGRGEYFRNKAMAADICTSEMDKYYDFDSAASYVNSIENMKSQYSLPLKPDV